MSERKGNWFLTYTGRQFWPLDPRPEDIDIRDIAHHLSLICRFNGGTRVHYSVAQHSIIVARMLPSELKFYGLMHDSPEAYIGDMVRPLKRSQPDFCKVEDLIWSIIALKYNIVAAQYPVNAARVKLADNIALMTERRDLLVKSPKLWTTKADPLPDVIKPMTPHEAEVQFLEMFDELEALNV